MGCFIQIIQSEFINKLNKHVQQTAFVASLVETMFVGEGRNDFVNKA